MEWLRQIARRRAGTTARWALEIIGVGVIVVGVWLALEPAAFILAGAYLVLIANSGGESGGRR